MNRASGQAWVDTHLALPKVSQIDGIPKLTYGDAGGGNRGTKGTGGAGKKRGVPGGVRYLDGPVERVDGSAAAKKCKDDLAG